VTHDQVEALTFADEVVVMKDGRILQIATPTQLFEQPDHTFVGYFIGSPGMNLVDAEIDGAQAQVGEQTIALPARYRKPSPGSSVRLGFRPDYTTLVPNGDLRVRVQKVEDLGRRRLARVSLGSQDIFATVPHGQSVPTETAAIAIKPERLFVYVNDERVTGEPL
jgi:glycerol transport system ATP-binding protein